MFNAHPRKLEVRNYNDILSGVHLSNKIWNLKNNNNKNLTGSNLKK